MPACVEYCLTNLPVSVRARLRNNDQHTVERRCLQRCGRCREAPFLVVDGERVTAAKHEALLDRVLDGDR